MGKSSIPVTVPEQQMGHFSGWRTGVGMPPVFDTEEQIKESGVQVA